jgi:hypothetical protein
VRDYMYMRVFVLGVTYVVRCEMDGIAGIYCTACA